MPTEIEKIKKENISLQKTYDRLSTNYANMPGMQKYLDQLEQRIIGNNEAITTSMLQGKLDELNYTSKNRGGK